MDVLIAAGREAVMIDHLFVALRKGQNIECQD